MKFSKLTFYHFNDIFNLDVPSEVEDFIPYKANLMLNGNVQNFQHFSFTLFTPGSPINGLTRKGQFIIINKVLFVVFRPSGFSVALFNVFLKNLIDEAMASKGREAYMWSRNLKKLAIKDPIQAMKTLKETAHENGFTFHTPSKPVNKPAYPVRSPFQGNNVLSFSRPIKNRPPTFQTSANALASRCAFR